MAKIDVPEEKWDWVWALNPLVLITTVDREGCINAAPYGMCMRVCHKPLMLAFGVNRKWHTRENVSETGEFTVNIPSDDPDLLKKLMVTAKPFPPKVNELTEAGLTALPSKKVKPPRVGECKAHFECRVDWMREVGDHWLVVGTVLAASVDADCVTERFELIVDKLRPVHYLGKMYKNIFIGIGEKHHVDLK
jgi:flavin reductase (DIM6/NTAB) family NADH-FMN oxidoreductase RutF